MPLLNVGCQGVSRVTRLRKISSSRILRLALLVLVLLIPLIPETVHAVNPSYVKTVVGSQSSVTISGVTTGDFLGVVVAPTTFASFSGFNIPTDTMGNTFTFICGATANSCQTTTVSFWTVAKSGGSDTISITCIGGGCTFTGGTMWVDQYTNVVASLGGNYHGNCGGSCPANSGTDSLQSGIIAGNGITVWEPMILSTGTGAGSPAFTATSATADGINPAPQTQTHCQASGTGLEACTYTSQTTANFPIFRVAYTSGGGTPSDDHGDVLLQGGTSSTTTSNSACYGNCGSPAITLINPNATHTVNFNTSITLFYAFQSPVNGFINNMTVNIARPYVNGKQIGIAIYTATCPVNISPFTSQCQGTLVTSKSSFVFGKGQYSTPSLYPVSAGTWIALAFSAQFSGADLNETNSVCSTSCFDGGHLQYTSGFTPAVLGGSARCAVTGTVCNTAGIDNTGMWAFLTGTNVASQIPIPTTGPCTNNFAQLDCLIPGMVNGLCSVVTASCQTSGALLWIIILTFLSFLLLTVGFASAHVTKFVAAGDVFIFFFLAWFFIFAGVGVLQSLVIIFFLFMGAVVFSKTARNYF